MQISLVQNLTLDIEFSVSTLFNCIIFTSGTGSFSYTKQRTEVVSFLSQSQFVSHGIFIKNPEHVYNYTVYLEPLTYWSWVAIALFLFSFPIFLFTMTRLVKEPEITSIFEAFETVFLSFFLMGSQFKPSCMTTRVVFVR